MYKNFTMQHLTHEDEKRITDLTIIGYPEEKATKAFIACNKDFSKAAMKLLNDRTFDKRFIQSYGDLMFAGKYIGKDLFEFSKKIDVVGNKYRIYILEDSHQEITTWDNTKVTKLMKNSH